MRIVLSLAMALLLLPASFGHAQNQFVNGGQTNVLLDTDTLSSVGLDLTGVSSDVIVPGELGGDSVAFLINDRDGSSPTTFAYTLFDLAPFSGSIEHTGSLFFDLNMSSIEVGNFSIGYDANRVMGDNSGFFVESTVGVTEILFDVENPSDLGIDQPGVFTLTANLLVSSEFASILGDTGLTGADVGDAFVNASAVPEPTGFGLLTLVGIAIATRRRK